MASKMLRGVVMLLALAGSVGAQVLTGLPKTWLGAGGGYSQETGKGSAWGSIAVQLDEKSGLYSYSTYDVQAVKSKLLVQTSTRTGLAFALRQWGPYVYLMGFATMGTGQIGGSVQGTFSGGGVLLVKGAKGWTGEIVVRGVTNSQSSKVFEVGFGKAF